MVGSRWAWLLLTIAVPAASAKQSEQDLASAHRLLMTGRDLSAVERFRSLAARHNGEADDARQSVWQYAPRLDGLTVARPVTGEPATVADVAAVAVATPRDAIATIVAAARDRRIVILNEAHDDPQHRAFGLTVARALRPLGFSILAAETFNNATNPVQTDMADLAKRGYPVRGTGAYTGDPVFGDFVRQALLLGYRPMAYEQTWEQRGDQQRSVADAIDRREEAQATNLAAALAASPGARVLIYVGYPHAAKTAIDAYGRSNRWMAARLWAKTGSEPLSIDQTTLGATSGSLAETMLRDAARKGGIAAATILFDGDQPLRFGQMRDAVDLQVVHPAVRLHHGRPDWLTTGRHPVRPPVALMPRHGRVLVQAMLIGERADAIPVDQLVLEHGSTRWFMLPDRAVRYVVKERLPEK